MDETLIRTLATCPRCERRYQDPRILSCGHTLCGSCLTELEVPCSTTESQCVIRCPCCQMDCSYAQRSVAANLPKNYLTQLLVDHIERRSNDRPVCQQCDYSLMQNGRGLWFCTTCEIVTCATCTLIGHRNDPTITFEEFCEKSRQALNKQIADVSLAYNEVRGEARILLAVLAALEKTVAAQLDQLNVQWLCVEQKVIGGPLNNCTDVKHTTQALNSLREQCEVLHNELKQGLTATNYKGITVSFHRPTCEEEIAGYAKTHGSESEVQEYRCFDEAYFRSKRADRNNQTQKLQSCVCGMPCNHHDPDFDFHPNTANDIICSSQPPITTTAYHCKLCKKVSKLKRLFGFR